jgi:hypothetical protein
MSVSSPFPPGGSGGDGRLAHSERDDSAALRSQDALPRLWVDGAARAIGCVDMDYSTAVEGALPEGSLDSSSA